MTFSNLGLSPKLLATVAREGYTEATPVQAAAILQGRRGIDVAAAWAPPLPVVAEPRSGQADGELRERYRRAAGLEELDG